MLFYELSHLSDSTLEQDGRLVATRERDETAILVAYIAEIDARGLFVAAGYSSMFAYCVKEYGLSEDAANARIQVARAARRYPFLFVALKEGRLHLTAVRLLAPHLTPQNADDLAAAATHQSMTEVQRLIARRFPLDEAPRVSQTIRVIPSAKVGVHVSRRVDPLFQGLNGSDANGAVAPSLATPSMDSQTPSDPSPPASGADLVPGACPPPANHHAPERYLVRFTVGRGTHDKLRYAQMLASHSIPGGNIERIMDEALDLFIERREKQKFAATDRPRTTSRPRVSPGPRPNSGPGAPCGAAARYVPAAVKRAVWKRDRGRCTFVSPSGQRCESRQFLEFDHIDPVARGGTATVERVRLRCRAHNQYEAEKAFGAEFMRAKREEARALARGASHEPVGPGPSEVTTKPPSPGQAPPG